MFSGAESLIGRQVDQAFFLILGICVAMLVLITFLMVFFVIKYNRKRHPIPENIEGNTLLEITWTVIPTILVLAMFYVGWTGYRQMQDVPAGAMTVKVTARMWSWLFEYENGKQSDVLNLPVGKPVKLVLSSEDVLHSFYVPAFRVKKDAVPGIKAVLWFTPDETGSFDLFCAEYCGVGHSAMLSKVVVMNEDAFTAWLKGTKAGEEKALEAKEPAGLALIKAKGCTGCHTIDGSPLVGPTLKGIFGSKVRVVTSGQEREVLADEEYLRKSMLDPNADVVDGFPPIMPSQKGKLTGDEIQQIIEYVKSLK